MSAAYIRAVRDDLPRAVHVFDRFHVVKRFNDKLRPCGQRPGKVRRRGYCNRSMMEATWITARKLRAVFSYARGHPPVALHLGPKTLHQVPILVALPVVRPLHLPVLPRRNHGLAAARLDGLHHGLAVVAPVGDHHLEWHVPDQRLGLGHVGRLARRQHQLHRQPQAVDGDVDLGPEAAPTAAQRLLVLAPRPVAFFSAPAAQGWARMTVESRISHSRSGSCRASNSSRQVPFRAQRSKRFQTEFQLPKRSGRSRQGTPVLAHHGPRR